MDADLGAGGGAKFGIKTDFDSAQSSNSYLWEDAIQLSADLERAEQKAARADRLAQQLRSLGIEPD